MYNFSKTCITMKRAQDFAKYLKAQNCEDITIWTGRDAFGQTEYIVKWNNWN